MILLLCTSVTERRAWSIAYWIALRTSRSVPSRDTGLMPSPDESGKRMPFTPISSRRNWMTFFASGDPAGHSTPT